MPKWWVKTRARDVGGEWRYYGHAPYAAIEAATREDACRSIVPDSEKESFELFLRAPHSDGTPQKPWSCYGGSGEICAVPVNELTDEEIREGGITFGAHVDLLTDPDDLSATLPPDWEEKYKLLDLALIRDYIPNTWKQNE
jgi:hypothetical protein